VQNKNTDRSLQHLHSRLHDDDDDDNDDDWGEGLELASGGPALPLGSVRPTPGRGPPTAESQGSQVNRY